MQSAPCVASRCKNRSFILLFSRYCAKTPEIVKIFAHQSHIEVQLGTAYENSISNKKLSYRKQIASQMHTQFVQGVYSNYAWSWNLGQGSVKVIGKGTIRYLAFAHEFLLAFRINWTQISRSTYHSTTDKTRKRYKSASVISPTMVKIDRDCVKNANNSHKTTYSAMVREMEESLSEKFYSIL